MQLSHQARYCWIFTSSFQVMCRYNTANSPKKNFHDKERNFEENFKQHVLKLILEMCLAWISLNVPRFCHQSETMVCLFVQVSWEWLLMIATWCE